MPLSEWWASLTIAERASLAIAALHVGEPHTKKKEDAFSGHWNCFAAYLEAFFDGAHLQTDVPPQPAPV